jgi:CheY-like chemotaxis protein
MSAGTREVGHAGDARLGGAGEDSKSRPDDERGSGRKKRFGRRLARALSPSGGEEPRQPQGVIRVFLCDDVGDVRLLTRSALEETGDLLVVGEADNGAEALEAISELDPDAVLVDLSMPGMDGFELITRIRETAPSVGILVFSGFGRDRMESRALEIGADGYLQKGESFAQVREVTRQVVRKRRFRRGEHGE